VYQEFTLVPDMTVADNIALGRERWPFLRRGSVERGTARRLAELGARCRPDAVVRTLSVADQQLVEIARALETEAKVMIFDEPTAALAGAEVERLLATIRNLRDRGLGVLYVSHRFAEIFAIADRITVLRDGRVAGSAPAPQLDRAQMIRWMVGREVTEEFPPRAPSRDTVVLDVRDLRSRGRFSGVSFELRVGQIAGVAGLVGAGRTSLGMALAGALPSDGTIAVEGRQVHPRSPAEALAHGIAYLTEDRKARGLLPLMSVKENLTLASLRRLAARGIIDQREERRQAASTAATVNVRGVQLDQPAWTLSGGTQQKVLLGRMTMERRKVLVLDEPTRGVDVGARAEIYELMNRLTASGVAILMISSDLPELLGMSDRVLVMREGRLAGTLDREAATAERVMNLATGA
jgi:ribose transport system ATP-binding protein